MIKKNILTEKKSRVVLTASVLFFAGFGQVYGQETKKDSQDFYRFLN
ncbi:hypothetical protein HZP35_09905 [Elizabethkingia anophelis]|nr:hypothetical protein [Elizabethkingia anophelis]MCT4243989.1 hypothetical protein [Elizabethkingia anophelis]MCT4247723.1 hypothetical protein [Elizabethkingia anophelis]MCT4258714.1 hypothetical protein [Elizabethkingia anophelis]